MTSPAEPTMPVEYLATARLGEKGQITLPKAYRDAVALDPGAPITVLQVGRGLLLIPENTQFRDLCDRIATTFASDTANIAHACYRDGQRGTTRKDPRCALPYARRRHRRYLAPHSSSAPAHCCNI
jgi:bifunctional DNA-binding transcriptional regulator/antitoxin component of YhaV-PrlF toxin-antitoxin module